MLNESSITTAAKGKPVRFSDSVTWAIISSRIATSVRRIAASIIAYGQKPRPSRR